MARGSTAIASSSRAIAPSSNIAATSASAFDDTTILKPRAKTARKNGLPPTAGVRQSARVAQTQSNRPDDNTAKQTVNLPSLPEEDAERLALFMASPDRVHQKQARKRTASAPSPSHKKSRKGKEKAFALNVDSADAFMNDAHPPYEPGHARSPFMADARRAQHHSPQGAPLLPSSLLSSPPPSRDASPSRSPTHLSHRNVASPQLAHPQTPNHSVRPSAVSPLRTPHPSPAGSEEHFTFTRSQIEAMISEHAEKLMHELNPAPHGSFHSGKLFWSFPTVRPSRPALCTCLHGLSLAFTAHYLPSRPLLAFTACTYLPSRPALAFTACTCLYGLQLPLRPAFLPSRPCPCTMRCHMNSPSRHSCYNLALAPHVLNCACILSLTSTKPLLIVSVCSAA